MLAGLLLLTAAGAASALVFWLRRDRRYESADSVAAAYDAWTDDRRWFAVFVAAPAA